MPMQWRDRRGRCETMSQDYLCHANILTLACRSIASVTQAIKVLSTIEQVLDDRHRGRHHACCTARLIMDGQLITQRGSRQRPLIIRIRRCRLIVRTRPILTTSLSTVNIRHRTCFVPQISLRSARSPYPGEPAPLQPGRGWCTVHIFRRAERGRWSPLPRIIEPRLLYSSTLVTDGACRRFHWVILGAVIVASSRLSPDGGHPRDTTPAQRCGLSSVCKCILSRT